MGIFSQRMFSNRYDLKIEILLLFPKSNQNKSIFIVFVPKYTESLYASMGKTDSKAIEPFFPPDFLFPPALVTINILLSILSCPFNSQ